MFVIAFKGFGNSFEAKLMANCLSFFGLVCLAREKCKNL